MVVDGIIIDIRTDHAFWLHKIYWQDYVKQQTRFVSLKPAKVILSTIEAVAESMGFRVHTRHYKVLS